MPEQHLRVRAPLRLTLALAVLVTALSVPAVAFDGNVCGGDHDGSAECGITIKGLPILVTGDAEASNASKPVDVRVWITLDGYPQVPIWECTGSGTGFARCGDGLPDQTTMVNFPGVVPGIRVVCHVEASHAGWYQCAAGTIPDQG